MCSTHCLDEAVRVCASLGYLHVTSLGEERLELLIGGGKGEVAGEYLLVVLLSLCDGLDVVSDGVDDALVDVGHCEVEGEMRMILLNKSLDVLRYVLRKEWGG